MYPGWIYAQDTISLDRCLRAAEENHPRQADYQILKKISDNNLENDQSGWYPAVNMNGSATYQSDVIEFNFNSPVPGLRFPVVPKDQYKLSLDVTQTIYDAGMTKKKKEMEKAGEMASVTQLKSDIGQEKDVIKNIYYTILLLQENKKITSLSLGQLDASRSVVGSGVDNGVLLSSDLDLIRVEIMKLQQNISELDHRKEALISVLADRTGLQLSGSDSLLLTGFPVPADSTLQRTELEVLDMKKAVLGKSADLLESRRLPVLFAFGQFGYGKPGLNMLNNQFDTWYLVGAGLKWNLWDWNTVKRDRANLLLQSDMLDHQKENLEMNLNEALTQQMAEIQTHRDNIEKFGEILSLREHITATYRSQLRNGTIKTNDFLDVVNKEKIARVQLASEKILLQKAIADYKYTQGTL